MGTRLFREAPRRAPHSLGGRCTGAGDQPEGFLLLSLAWSPLLHPFPSPRWTLAMTLATPQRLLQGQEARGELFPLLRAGRTQEGEKKPARPPHLLHMGGMEQLGLGGEGKPFPRLLSCCSPKTAMESPLKDIS